MQPGGEFERTKVPHMIILADKVPYTKMNYCTCMTASEYVVVENNLKLGEEGLEIEDR